MLVLAHRAGRADEAELRRLIAADVLPDAILAEDAFAAESLDEGDLERVRGPRGRFLGALPEPIALALLAWGRRGECDIVMSWGEQLAFPLALILAVVPRRRLRHIAILMWPFEESSPSRARRIVKRIGFRVLARRGIDRLCVPAPRQRELALRRWRLPADRLVLANWPVDVGYWRPREGTTDTICSVGREMRDYGTLIEALEPLSIPCHIAAGSGVQNAASGTEDRRSAGVGDRPLPDGVSVGAMSLTELRELYGRSRAVVVPLMPSASDNGVTTIVEAMAMGRPVIASATEGRAAILDDGANCLLVPPRDPAALRVAIESLWNDPPLCERLGAEGRRRVVREHGIDQWVSAMRAAAADLRRTPQRR